MRSRVLVLVLLFAIGSFVLPLAAHAQAIPFLGPIIPDGFQRCPAGWGMLMTVINNVIRLLLTLAIVFVAPLMIAYSGFLFVVNPVNESGISKAKGILTHTVVGIVIALAGWMIVAAIMAALYSAPSGWGTWSSLITGSGDACLQQQGAPYIPGPPPPPTTVTGTPGAGRFTFNPGIEAQVSNESTALASLLTCMSSKLTANAVITSISDSKITSGQQTFSSCRTNGSPTCAHSRNSCHYGGTSCGDSSYAVDLVGNTSNLTAAVQACGGRSLNEGSHLHASVGAANSCGCDNF